MTWFDVANNRDATTLGTFGVTAAAPGGDAKDPSEGALSGIDDGTPPLTEVPVPVVLAVPLVLPPLGVSSSAVPSSPATLLLVVPVPPEVVLPPPVRVESVRPMPATSDPRLRPPAFFLGTAAAVVEVKAFCCLSDDVTTAAVAAAAALCRGRARFLGRIRPPLAVPLPLPLAPAFEPPLALPFAPSPPLMQYPSTSPARTEAPASTRQDTEVHPAGSFRAIFWSLSAASEDVMVAAPTWLGLTLT